MKNLISTLEKRSFWWLVFSRFSEELPLSPNKIEKCVQNFEKGLLLIISMYFGPAHSTVYLGPNTR